MMLPFFPPVFAYAETHYRFKYFFSFLKKSEPEIIADAPHRLEPGSQLPLLILIKDADRYPVILETIEVDFLLNGVSCAKRIVFSDRIEIREPLWWRALSLDLPQQLSVYEGEFYIDVHITYSAGGKRKHCRNDNHRTSSKNPLRIYRATAALPQRKGWIQGDVHTHSSYTSDQVEFGSPMKASILLSKAMGMSFFCVADHSYDLDDRVDNYLVNDPDLPKWKMLQKEIDQLNSAEEHFAVVRGEEVSCWNNDQRNVHLLLFGTRKFFPGSGDSAEKWFQTKAEHSISDVLTQRESGTVAYAAHPTEPTPILQRLLIKRGEWTEYDMRAEGLSGIQILNEDDGLAFQRGLEMWKKLLLAGKKLFIAGGNDSHGNFNRYRQIGIPFFTIREAATHLFGKMRTALYVPATREENILHALQNGRAIVTNGPFASLRIITPAGIEGMIGDSIVAAEGALYIEGLTTEEFGRFDFLTLYQGEIGSSEEKIVLSLKGDKRLFLNHELLLKNIGGKYPCYFRLEARTSLPRNGTPYGFCYTNPLWIHQPR